MKPPRWLPKAAAAEWRRIWPILAERETITDADLSTLEAYCLASGQVQQCQLDLRAGLTTTTAAGELKAHPAVRIQHTAMAHARALARQLGITPASRDGAKPVRKGEANDWAGLAS